jgi:hypothetical protein
MFCGLLRLTGLASTATRQNNQQILPRETGPHAARQALNPTVASA